MSSTLALVLVTLVPLSALLAGTIVSALRIRSCGEYRLVLLPAILILMAQHQTLEAVSYVQTGTGASLVASEFLETGANVLATVAVYFGVELVGRKQELADRLSESEQRYRALTEQSPLPILVVQDGSIAFANRAAGAVFAAGDADLLVGEEIDTLVPDGVEAFPGNGTENPVEQRWRDLDGAVHHVVVSAGRATYRGEDSLYLVCQDVTEREQYRREYEQTKSQLESALENSNDGILIIDTEEREIVDANERATEMLGYSHEELVGLDPSAIHPHERDRLETFFQRVTEESDLVTDELSCMRRDGEKIPVDISGSTTEYGSRECVLVVVRDVTERRQRRKQIEVLQRVLRHNLRNDMMVVMGLAEEIESTGGDQIADLAARIRATAKGLVSTTETVREIQGVVERDTLEPTHIDIAPVVDSVVDEVRSRYPDATIETEVPSATTVRGTDALERAIVELVENAIEHNDAPEPYVKISVQRNNLRRGDWVDISVVDNGPGIPDHERAVVDMDAPEAPLSHATGMGLWEVSHLVTALDGEVSVDTRSEGGSIVTIHLKTPGGPDSVSVAV